MDYHDAEIWYDVKPPCDMYHDSCHRCWREDPAFEDFAETSESSDDEAGSDGIAEWVDFDEI